MKLAFRHVRVVKGDNKLCATGGFTIAAEFVGKDQIAAYAVAWCHNKDNYNKRVGRMKAGGRLKSPRFRVEFDVPKSLDEVIINALTRRFEAMGAQVIPKALTLSEAKDLLAAPDTQHQPLLH